MAILSVTLLGLLIIILTMWQYRHMIMFRIMNWGFSIWFMKEIVPFIRFGFYYTSMRGWKYSRGYDLLRPGDIILTRDNKKLTTWFIPGVMPHAALCVGLISEGDDYEIGEMICKGYTKSFFFDLAHESDRIVIIRCTDWDEKYTQKVIQKCKSFEGTPYDLVFGFDIASLYCSELVFQADYERRLIVNLEDSMLLGFQQYVSAQDLFEAENVEVIWDSNEETIEDASYNTAMSKRLSN